jgi:uncharacterized protein
VLNVRESPDGVSFEVRVIPRAPASAVRGVSEGALKVALAAPPVDGAANAALIEFLSDLLAVPRRAVEIVRGERSKRKVVRVSGIAKAALQARIAGG